MSDRSQWHSVMQQARLAARRYVGYLDAESIERLSAAGYWSSMNRLCLELGRQVASELSLDVVMAVLDGARDADGGRWMLAQRLKVEVCGLSFAEVLREAVAQALEHTIRCELLDRLVARGAFPWLCRHISTRCFVGGSLDGC